MNKQSFDEELRKILEARIESIQYIDGLFRVSGLGPSISQGELMKKYTRRLEAELQGLSPKKEEGLIGKVEHRESGYHEQA